MDNVKNKRISELEIEVKKLQNENKVLHEQIKVLNREWKNAIIWKPKL